MAADSYTSLAFYWAIHTHTPKVSNLQNIDLSGSSNEFVESRIMSHV